jgi:hypothetical protein
MPDFINLSPEPKTQTEVKIDENRIPKRIITKYQTTRVFENFGTEIEDESPEDFAR